MLSLSLPLANGEAQVTAGDGFAPNSTAQIEQEKRMKPGAGFSLHMPLTPQ